MSMQELAKAVQSEGRGNDTVLIHMTPSEVGGLQSLAKAHGGSLTVNPKTGLPEAGFLEDILPTLAGVGLSFIPGVGPLAAAGIVGAGTALASGDLNKGIMAGLGAYGGAGIGAGLAGSGAAAAQDFAMQGANAAAGSAATGLPAFDPIAGQMVNESMLGGVGNAQSLAAIDATKNFLGMSPMDQLQAGIAGLGTEAGRGAFMQGIGGTSGLLKAGYGVAAPLLAGMQPTMGQAPQEDDTERMRYEYRPNYTGGVRTPGSAVTSQQTYFRPEFVRMAEGGSPEEKLTGASREAYEYLMGRSGASPVTTAALDRAAAIAAPVPPPAAAAAPVAVAKRPERPLTERVGNFKMYGVHNTPADQTDETGSSGLMSLFAPPAEESRPRYRYEQSSGRYIALAKGGLAKGGFVVPADVVSALGNGSTDAGLRALEQRLGDVKPIKGPGDGLSDSIATSIEGKQPARVADGEAYVSPETVKRIGGGDQKRGAQKLYAMMDKVRRAAHGKSTQQRPVNPKAVV